MGGQIVSELTMNSPWACQVNTPSPPVTGEPKVIDLTGGPAVVDLASEEEEQALEEIERGVVTFNVKVRAARADPAPEYEAPPNYLPSYPNSPVLD